MKDNSDLAALPRLESGDGTLDAVLRFGTSCVVSPGRILTQEGAQGRDAFFVVEGTARVAVRGRVIARVGPGDVVGDMALIDHRARSATVTADTEMSLVAFDAPGFAALLDDPAGNRAVRRALVARLRTALDRQASE